MRGGVVVVWCGVVVVRSAAGASRSASFLIGYIMWKHQSPYETILAKTKAVRYVPSQLTCSVAVGSEPFVPCLCCGRPLCELSSAICPNMGFQAQLVDFEKRGFHLK